MGKGSGTCSRPALALGVPPTIESPRGKFLGLIKLPAKKQTLPPLQSMCSIPVVTSTPYRVDVKAEGDKVTVSQVVFRREQPSYTWQQPRDEILAQKVFSEEDMAKVSECALEYQTEVDRYNRLHQEEVKMDNLKPSLQRFLAERASQFCQSLPQRPGQEGGPVAYKVTFTNNLKPSMVISEIANGWWSKYDGEHCGGSGHWDRDTEVTFEGELATAQAMLDTASRLEAEAMERTLKACEEWDLQERLKAVEAEEQTAQHTLAEQTALAARQALKNRF